MSSLRFQQKLKSLALVTLGGLGAYTSISLYKNDPKFYKTVVMPLVHLLDPERTHELGIFLGKHRLIPKTKFADPDSLKVTIFNRELSNPIGIAAGFDKNGEAILGLQDMGFGFVEIGSVTPEPQRGNDKPRVFRLSQDLAVINRYGFNNDGHEKVLQRLVNVKTATNITIGVNLGKNKASADPVNDYVVGIDRFGPFADYLVINVSSPNTPGLRQMQQKSILKELLQAALAARNRLERRPALLVKLAPDLTQSELKDIADVLLTDKCKVDGVIISNTTIGRPECLISQDQAKETGGLSGKPLKDQATSMIAQMYKLTKGKIPIVGVGGIFSGRDAYDKIKAGATVVQLYTSLVYEGPPVVTAIKKELNQLLIQDGFRTVSEAVGKDVR